MMRASWWVGVMLALLCTVKVQAEGQETGAAETEDSGKPEPAKVGDEAQILMRKVSLELDNTPLSEAMEFMKSLVKVNVTVSKGAADKVVSLKLANATLSEALYKIKEQAGAVHRVQEGKLLLATPEEWKEVDAGKSKFEPWKDNTEIPKKDEGASQNSGVKVVRLDKVNVSKNSAFPVGEIKPSQVVIVGGKEHTLDQLKKEKPELYEAILNEISKKTKELQEK